MWLCNFWLHWCLTHVAGDLNETYYVGNVDEESKRLVQCTYECLEKAISIGMCWMYEICEYLKSQRISFPFLILLKHLLWYTSSISISNSLEIRTILPAEEKLIFLLLSVKPGIRFREIGEVINRHASMSGFSVVIYYLNLHFFSISIFWKGLDSFY